MTEEKGRKEDLTALAEEAMADKREEVGDENRSRELWDVPTESGADLAEQQQEG